MIAVSRPGIIGIAAMAAAIVGGALWLVRPGKGFKRRARHFLDGGDAELPPQERLKHVGGFRGGSGSP